MPDLDMWTIDKCDESEIRGTELPESAEHIWQGKNCDTVMIELMCIYGERGLYAGSLENENMVLRPLDVGRVEAVLTGESEHSEKGAAEAQQFIELARSYHRDHPDKALVVGVWL